MKFHPGRLGIMAPKGETLADIDLLEKIKEDEENRKEAARIAKNYGTTGYYSPLSYSTIGYPVRNF